MPSTVKIATFELNKRTDKRSGSFHQLVQDLSSVLGPSSGLDSSDVDPQGLAELMLNYQSDDSEWGRYAFKEPTRPFTRNLVDEGNGKSNLVCAR